MTIQIESYDDITPMPSHIGVGFVSKVQLDEKSGWGYRYEQSGRYHNYFFTPADWSWPVDYHDDYLYNTIIIDAFSPNLNKELHVGHLRQLALATCLHRLYKNADAYFVALLGCSLGVKKAALEGWKKWCQFTEYNPKLYYDTVLPIDVIETKEEPLSQEELAHVQACGIAHGDPSRPQVWTNSKGENVRVIRSDGRYLYTFYDLVFAKEVGPTHYITGQEQRSHFESLDLGDKHLPMGLVLGYNGKKLKSRTGDALSATEAMDLTKNCLKETNADKDKIAWNILAWNMLQSAREKDIKFEVENWVRPEAPGMYITYTYARICSALGNQYPSPLSGLTKVDAEFLDEDIKLMGFAAQAEFWTHKSRKSFNPAPLANFAFDLARELTAAYNREKVSDGRKAFKLAMRQSAWVLQQCMHSLGMFPLVNV